MVFNPFSCTYYRKKLNHEFDWFGMQGISFLRGNAKQIRNSSLSSVKWSKRTVDEITTFMEGLVWREI